QGLPFLVERPSVPESPLLIRYRTADLRWPGAWWVTIQQLEPGLAGRVEAERDPGRNFLRLRTERIRQLAIDPGLAGLSPADLELEADVDRPVVLLVGGVPFELDPSA